MGKSLSIVPFTKRHFYQRLAQYLRPTSLASADKSPTGVWLGSRACLTPALRSNYSAVFYCLVVFVCSANILSIKAYATIPKQSNNETIQYASIKPVSNKDRRIISLSPHLTELVYAIGGGQNIIAASDYSDFPKIAKTLPTVASYQGANIAEIIRLQPTHILAWRGGNKDADIKKLKLLGFNVFESRIQSLQDLESEIVELGVFLGEQKKANALAASIRDKLAILKKIYLGKSRTFIYYLSTQPFMGLGSDPWLNDLLQTCGLNNLYKNSLGAYPQLQLADVLRKKPDVVIAAGKYSQAQMKSFWSPHLSVFNPNLVIANPDALHRFTPRSVDELIQVCKRSYQ